MLKSFYQLLHTHKLELFLLTLLLTIKLLTFGYNIEHFPYFENDEAFYLSQAWSIIHRSDLGPYTYWYDHTPAGAIQLAVWLTIVGDIFKFDFSILPGRYFMLSLQLLNSVLIYLIIKKVTNSRFFAFLALTLYILSPLTIYLGRRVLLDSIMTFWLILTTYLLVSYRNNLLPLLASAITLAICTLSKENGIIFFVPTYLYLIFNTNQVHRRIVLLLWPIIFFSIISLYPLYALLRSELFPSDFFHHSTSTQHVSLIGTLQFHLGRDGGSIFDPSNSHFWQHFHKIWFTNEPFTLLFGTIATLCNLFLLFRSRYSFLLSTFSLIMIAFLMRGGIVLDFYILPLLPLLILNISYFAWYIYDSASILLRHQKYSFITLTLPIAIVSIWTFQFISNIHSIKDEPLSLYRSDQTSLQLAAVNWIKQNIPTDKFIAMDNYAFLEMRFQKPIYPNAHWYIKIDNDPAISETILKNNYQNIDYVVYSPQIQTDLQSGEQNLTMLHQALQNSVLVRSFKADHHFIEIYQQNK
jgi:4-amino-4-deoxy-L-arabinose transferase-like glycosyltransferase